MKREDSQAAWVPLWEAGRVAREVSEGVIYQNVDDAARRELAGISGVREKVVGALKHPKPLCSARQP